MALNYLNIGLMVFPLRDPDIVCGQTFIDELTQVLSPLAEKVYIVTGNLHLDNAASNVRVVNVKAPVVKTHQESLLLKVFRFISAQVSVSLKLLQWHNKMDLVVLFTLVGPLFLPAIIAKLVRKRVIVIASGSNAQILGKQYPSVAGQVFAKIIAFTEHINYMIADRLVVYSQQMASSLGIEKYNKKTITDGYRSYLDTAHFRVTQPLETRQPVIGYVGRLIGEKGVIELARAIPLILQERNDLRFLIIGDGPLLEQMKEILAQGKCLAEVEFTGWVPAAEVPDYLNRMRLLVLPSYTEGLPKSVLEAMACGTPVLVTPVGALPDIVKDKDTGFIMEDNTPNCIAQSIVETLAHPYLEKIARNARALVENRFTFQAALERYRNILNSLGVAK